MMDNIILRDARDDEAEFIVQMIRNMVTDMAGYGGNAPATDNAAWEKVAATVAAELRGTTPQLADKVAQLESLAQQLKGQLPHG